MDRDDAPLQRLDIPTEPFDHREVMVPDGVEERIEQRADTALDRHHVAPEACRHLVDLVDRRVVYGDQIVFTEENIEFVLLDTLGRPVIIEIVEDQE